jgi:hypothetical protein
LVLGLMLKGWWNEGRESYEKSFEGEVHLKM